MSIAFSALPARAVGIDAGASLCKVARKAKTLEARTFDSNDLSGIRRTLNEWAPDCVMATGGGATRLADRVTAARVRHVPEFEAWACGAPILAELSGFELPNCYLLVSLGTGTSILQITGSSSQRIGGSALGGGTLLGLGRLLLDVESYQEVCELASRGDRSRVDLSVGDIYPDGVLPLPANLNASSFGKLASREPADLAHALVGMLGETLGLLCGQLAHARGAAAVVYCGSSLNNNPTLLETLRTVTHSFGPTVHALENGAYCGAIGALALGES